MLLIPSVKGKTRDGPKLIAVLLIRPDGAILFSEDGNCSGNLKQISLYIEGSNIKFPCLRGSIHGVIIITSDTQSAGFSSLSSSVALLS